jgi:hypothetical protein
MIFINIVRQYLIVSFESEVKRESEPRSKKRDSFLQATGTRTVSSVADGRPSTVRDLALIACIGRLVS